MKRWTSALVESLVTIPLVIPLLAGSAVAQDAESGDKDARPSSLVEYTLAGSVMIDFNADPLAFDGIHIRHGAFHWHVGGRFTVDGIKYSYANERDSGLEFDTAMVRITGEYGDFSGRFEPDLIGVDTPRNLFDAWLAWERYEALRLKAGQFRVALGTEYATPEEDLALVGYGFTSYLDGRYDIGARADGDLFSKGLWYEANATIGKGFDLEGYRRSNPQFSLRLVGHPFRWIDPDGEGVLRPLQGFFAGIGLAYLTDYDEPIILDTPFESRVFDTKDLDGDDGNFIHYELGGTYGPFRVGFERVNGSANDVPIGGGEKEDMDQLTSWSITGAWNITGEDQAWGRGRWQRPAPRNRTSGTWRDDLPGRWEVGVRYANADIDRDLFEGGLTAYGISTQEVRTFSLTLNWYPVENTRLALGWVKTIADQDLGTFGDTDRDSSYVLRLELNF